MVDVNRIREQAADWLGDVGDAALRAAISRIRGARTPEEVMQAWREWYRSVGAVPSEPRSATAAPSYACGDSGCRMVGQEQNRAGACPACWRELEALPDEDAATDPSGPVDMQRTQNQILDAAGRVRSAAPGARPFMAASQFSADEAARLEANGWTSGIVWYHDDPCGTWHESDADDLAHLRASAAPAVASDVASVDGIEAWIGQPSRDLAAAWNTHAGIGAKPAAVAMSHRWICVGVESELEVCELRPAIAGFSGEVGLRPPGSAGPATVRAREADMLGLKEWRFLG